MKLFLLILATFIIIGCSPDLDEAKQFPYNAQKWASLTRRQYTGDGNNEFEKNRDKEAAIKEIDAVKNKIFFTYRTVYRTGVWKTDAKIRNSWAKIEAGILPTWEPRIRPEGEPVAGNYLPWLISNYDYESKSFRLIPAPFDCFCNDRNCIKVVSYVRCFGDPPPTADYDGGTSYSPGFAYGDSWAWYDNEVLNIKMNEQDAEEFVNSLMGSSFSIKIFYKYFSSSENAVIVQSIGYNSNDDKSVNILFETEYFDNKNDDTIFKAGRTEGDYWSHFTR